MRVLVARLDSVGDVLLSGPAIRAVAAEAQTVAMICGPQGTAAAEMLPGVDQVITWDAPWITTPSPPVSPGLVRSLLTRVAQFRPDAAVLFTSFHQSPLPLAMLLRLAGVPHITGASVDHAGSLLDVRLIPGEDFPEDQPEVVRALDIASAAGFTRPGDDRLRVTLDDRRTHLAPPPPTVPYVVVHPGADAPARQWPPDHYRALVPQLSRRGYEVLVTGSPTEMSLTDHVAGDVGMNLGGRTSLPGLAGLLAGAEAIITGNTGPAHLAAAVGTPVVSLFSPVVPAIRWAPWKVPAILLGDQQAPCRGTRARTCPVPGHPCLATITPATVLEALDRLIRSTDLPRPRVSLTHGANQ